MIVAVHACPSCRPAVWLERVQLSVAVRLCTSDICQLCMDAGCLCLCAIKKSSK